MLGDYTGGMGGAPGQDFAAMPRLINAKPKFKDPYGRNIEEYFPQNIMHDRRIMRGSTYAAMVIPAGTNPDAMVMDKNYPKKRTFRKPGISTKKTKNLYPNRDIPTPEPVPGRMHMDVQTEPYKEILTDKPAEREQGIATEFYLDRPPVPLFQPKMPSKENCKATQIYEGDYELFNFNEEVEPMLNVLCSKTLEQARMEVLEETELANIKSEQKEYEEIVNAELIIAQRYEAAEQRCKEEVSRRNVQDKARKQEKKAAHQKINARQLTKNYMQGLREQALSQLSSQGILVAPQHRAIQEEVVPWFMSKIQDFLQEDQATVEGSQKVVVDGILDAQNTHAGCIKAKYESIKKAEQDKIDAKKANEIRKKERREAREKRAKDQALEKFKDEVERHVIFKGEVNDVLKTNLMDIHGNYQEGRQLGALGGHLQQIYYVLEEIMKKYPQGLKNYMEKRILNDDEDYFMKPNNPRELLLQEHLIPFLMKYLKDMKTDSIDILLHPKCKKFLDESKVEYDDLKELTDDDVIKFRALFIENKVSRHHRGTEKMMDTLYDHIIDIVSNRFPVENNNTKFEQVKNKIRLLPIPDEVVDEDYSDKVAVEQEDGTVKEELKQFKKNTNEHGLILINVPQIEQTDEIPIEVTGSKDTGEDKSKSGDGSVKKTKTVRKMVDEDQGHKALAVTARDIQNMPDKNFFVINKYAGTAYREHFLEYITQEYQWFFDENNDHDEILDAANKQAQQDIENFIKKNCGEYEFPCLEYTVNAPDL